MSNARRSAVVAVLALSCGLLLPAVSHAGGNNPGFAPPGSTPRGTSFSDWSARWWQWAYSVPFGSSCFTDNTGANVAVGQSGKVWFLCGTFNTDGVVTRNIQIPSGTALYFPIVNASCDDVEAPPFYGGTQDELRACVAPFLFDSYAAELDGRPVTNLADYFVTSSFFDFTLPPDNILGLPGGTTADLALDVGYYLFIEPLSVGQHTLHFSGRVYAIDVFSLTLDITYNITVVPRGKY